MKKAILFDMDGVLIDSHDTWFERFNAALKHFGFSEISVEEFDKNIWAINFTETVHQYFPGKTVDEIREYYRTNSDRFIENIKKMENVDEILVHIKKQGLKTAIVSNSQTNLIKTVLTKIDISKYFDITIGGERVKHGKPNPEILLVACNELNLKPEETIMIGDTIYDKQAAEAAGCDFIGYKMGDIDDLMELKEKIK
ncbi:MAG: HAD family hydrolase [Nanoarchaeota archaeon]|nr:HAD family hydrolase [Nanoarchaeota archaeon]